MGIIRWMIPPVGHLGIATTDGLIHDFAGPFFIHVLPPSPSVFAWLFHPRVRSNHPSSVRTLLFLFITFLLFPSPSPHRTSQVLLWAWFLSFSPLPLLLASSSPPTFTSSSFPERSQVYGIRCRHEIYWSRSEGLPSASRRRRRQGVGFRYRDCLGRVWTPHGPSFNPLFSPSLSLSLYSLSHCPSLSIILLFHHLLLPPSLHLLLVHLFSSSILHSLLHIPLHL